jgi:tetratricopeptide (TPR) repeat protein
MARSLILAAGMLLAPALAFANAESAALRLRAGEAFYNLDLDRAAATYRQAIAVDPEDAAAYRGLASTLWTSITFSRGMLIVDNYLGGVTRQNLKLPAPPADAATGFNDALNHALALARKRIAENPRSADAQYDLGSAIGLRASYIATIDGGMLGAFRAARDAYDAHETVLALNPERRDAGLIVGTYRYLVSLMSMPFRWAAYVAGFGGGRQKGLQLIESAAEYQSENQADSRVALVLLYNRERRYAEALQQLAKLQQRYPRNRLFWLESAATALRAGRAADAERMLNEGFAKAAADGRPRMFSEEAIWFYKRGAARSALGRASEAEQDLRKAVSLNGRNWVSGRARLELGKLALKAGNVNEANAEFRAAITLCDADNDVLFATEARRLMK